MSLDVSTLAIKVQSSGIKEAADGLNKVYREAGKTNKRVDTLIKNIHALNMKFSVGKSAAGLYMEAMKKSQLTAATYSGDINKLSMSVELLSRSVSKMTNNLNSNTKAAVVNQKAVRMHTMGMSDAKAMARGLSGSLGTLWLTYGNMAPMIAGVAIGSAMKKIVTGGMELEHTLEMVRIRTGATIEEFDQMLKMSLDIGKGVFGPQEVAEGLQVLTLAGLQAADAIKGVGAALNLALVGGTSIEQASETLVQVGTAFGISADGFEMVADVISKTANVSIASVESVSKSLMTASVVGKLYGASLFDVSTQLAALANLGIKGTAAGTAIRNFYKFLDQGNEKATATLKLMGLSLKDLKDDFGNFLPSVKIFEKINEGLNKLDISMRKTAMAALANQRGNKVLVEGIDLTRKRVVEIENGVQREMSAYESLFLRIKNSAGETSLQAVAAGLTTKKQIESVFNTLESNLTNIFSEIAPEMNMFARNMKEAINSEEFSSSIKAIAKSLMELAKWVSENLKLLFELFKAFLLFKAAMFLVNFFQATATAILAVSEAMKLGRIAAIAFQASLGVVGIALAAASAALVWYMSKKDELQNSAKNNAHLAYMKDFENALEKEIELTKKQVEAMEKGKTAAEAYTESIQKQNFQKYVQQLDKAIEVESKRVEEIGDRFGKFGDKYRIALISLNNLTTKRNGIEQDFLNKQAELVEWKQRQAALVEKETKERTKLGRLTGGGLKLEDASTASASLIQIQNEINTINDNLKSSIEDINSAYKIGTIGRLSQIKQTRDAQISAINAEVEAIKKKMAIASKADKPALTQRLINAESKAKREADEADKNAARQTAEYISKLKEDTVTDEIKALKLRGEYVLAAEKELTDGLDKEINRLKDSRINATLEQITVIDARLKQLEDRAKAARDAAVGKEAHFGISATLESAKTEAQRVSSTGGSLGLWGWLFPEDGVQNLRNNIIPDLIDQANKLEIRLKAGEFRDEDKKKLEKDLQDIEKFITDNLPEFDAAVQKYIEGSARGMERVWTNSFSAMEDALTEFIKTGKMDFKGFVDVVLSELARMQAKALISSLSNVGSSSGGLLGSLLNVGMSAIGSLFPASSTGSLAGFGTGESVASSGMVGSLRTSGGGTGMRVRMATGGHANPFTIGEVNEKGPELLSSGGKDYLMMGSQGGTVTPNHKLGGGSVELTYAPTIHIDSRTDQQQVRALVENAVAQGNAQMVDKLQRAGKI